VSPHDHTALPLVTLYGQIYPAARCCAMRVVSREARFGCDGRRAYLIRNALRSLYWTSEMDRIRLFVPVAAARPVPHGEGPSLRRSWPHVPCRAGEDVAAQDDVQPDYVRPSMTMNKSRGLNNTLWCQGGAAPAISGTPPRGAPPFSLGPLPRGRLLKCSMCRGHQKHHERLVGTRPKPHRSKSSLGRRIPSSPPFFIFYEVISIAYRPNSIPTRHSTHHLWLLWSGAHVAVSSLFRRKPW
jgi:hypothetical protein